MGHKTVHFTSPAAETQWVLRRRQTDSQKFNLEGDGILQVGRNPTLVKVSQHL